MKTFPRVIKFVACLFCVLSLKTVYAQNVGISSSGSFTPDASAGLDVSYANKGLLIPRVALTATNAAGPITTPATSLLVYNTATAGTSPNNVIPGYYYWNGTAWNMLTTSTQATNFWSTTGNAGTSYLTNFLGTTDNQSLRFRTNNTQRFLLDSLGNAAIGLSPTFSSNIEKLLVDAGTTSSFNVISGKGNINNYLQLNIQNSNAGTTASSDVVATADNGSETVNYVDMGINSSANTAAFFGTANDAYLYNAGGTVGGNFFIGTSTSGKALGFMTGGGATTNERMRIDGTGNVGIGTTTPTQKLDVKGTIVASATTYPNYAYNTANRMAFGESVVPPNETGSVVQFGSGSNSRNMLFAFSKTSVNTSFLGNDGTQTMLGSEGTSNPITFKTGLTYNAANIIGSGTEAMRITATSNVGIGTTTPATKLHVFGANPLTLSGVVTGTSTTADSLLTITSGLVRKLPLSTFASPTNSWSITGNAGTTAGTNFIGTTDANDMVFKANNVERMRIVNGTSSATGTTGDITVGDANSGTLRSNKEIVLRQDGDAFGPSTLRLRNRSGQNGAVFETTGGTANLVDFSFNTGPVATPISSNIRFETRSGNMKVSGNTTEWQFGQPDINNGGPTLVIGAYGTGSNSAFLTGKVGIGTNSPATKLHVFGANPLTLSGVVTGTSTTADSLLTITNGLVRKLPISTFASGGSWSTTGNAGINYRTNFLGTTDNQSLRFRTNNTQRLLVDSLGNVAIGLAPVFTASPNAERLLVDAGSTSANPSTSYNVINGKGYLDSYLQLNIQNMAPTASASSDIVATADNGSETANFIDMGINSSGNTSTGAIGGASTAYLYGTGNDMAIGNGTANKSLIFFTGGTSPSTYTERIRLDASGKVGIGTNAPTSDLTIFQSAGTGGAKGVRFTGNSIGGASSGSGFLFALGYNSSGNKQIWFGDPDAANNSASTFLRVAAGTANLPTLDAVAGDNSTRRTLALGTVGDPNGGVMFGNDNGGSTSPSSYVWDNGNMAIGSGYKANAAPSNGLIVQGNVGIGTTGPSQALDVNGSINAANSVYVDGAGTNTGTKSPGLFFGSPTSGEGIASKRTAGTNQYGLDFYTSSNLRMSIVGTTGYVGIGTNTPTSTIDITGSVAQPITVSSTAITLGVSNYTVVLTAASAVVVTLPAASTCPRRMYVLVNENVAKTTSINYLNFSAASVNTIPANSSITIQSDGTNWYRIQ